MRKYIYNHSSMVGGFIIVLYFFVLLASIEIIVATPVVALLAMLVFLPIVFYCSMAEIKLLSPIKWRFIKNGDIVEFINPHKNEYGAHRLCKGKVILSTKDQKKVAKKSKIFTIECGDEEIEATPFYIYSIC